MVIFLLKLGYCNHDDHRCHLLLLKLGKWDCIYSVIGNGFLSPLYSTEIVYTVDPLFYNPLF